MKTKILKAISLLLVMILVATISVGCGSGNTPGNTPNNSPNTSEGSSSNGEAEYNFVIGHGSSERSVNHYVAQRAAELMEQKSNGRIKTTIYPNASLGKTRELIEGTIDGTIDLFPYVSNGFVEFVNACAIFDMASLSPSIEVMRQVLDDPEIIAALEPEFEKAGLKFFGFSDAGYRQLTANRPINSLEDFKGLKVRVMENKNQIAYWEALGANPTPMDYSEVYISLQQGTIDAQENPLDLIVDAKFYEVQKYLVKTSHIPFSLIMPMNLEKFNSLPADLQQVVTESLIQANKDTREWADNIMKDYEKTLAENGVETIILPDEVYAQMKERAETSYNLIREQVGDELVDKMLTTVEKYSK
ncbi:MAG: TRAP transporter substrate-binding protein [Bacillota bacterium]|jgi:tripartite ATP-independent transporter DctP family solute receptor